MDQWTIIMILTFFLLAVLFTFPVNNPNIVENKNFRIVNDNIRKIILHSNKNQRINVIPTRGRSGYTSRGIIYVNNKDNETIEEITQDALTQVSSLLHEKNNKEGTIEIWNDLQNIYEKLKDKGELLNV